MSGQISPSRSQRANSAPRAKAWLRFGPPLVSLTALAWAGCALAQTTVSSDTSTPLQTSKSGDITVNGGVNVKPPSGVAVTVDSNNNLTNNGTIAFHNVDNSTAVQVLGGHTTTINNTGAIVSDADDSSSTDSNGIVHGPFAKGTNRFGLRLTGPDPVTGTITNAASGVISVIGNNSTALSIETNLNGSLSSTGAITATGDNSYALRSTGAISGNVTLGGTITGSGQAVQGVSLGDVGGAVNITSTVTTTGYRYTTRSTSTQFLNLLTADDLLQGGAAVSITGNVGQGVLLDSQTTTDSSGAATTVAASINSFSGAPALVVGAAGRSITLGNVGTGAEAFGLEIKGSASANGVYDGVAATAVQVGVANGGTVDTTGGIRNTGTIGTQSYAASSTALHVLSGANAPILKNEGGIASVMNSDAAGGVAGGVIIDKGATVRVLQNSDTITATVAGQKADVIAVQDKSGTLTEVENIRSISAARTLSDPSVPISGRNIALDLSANTTGVHIVQYDQSNGATAPSILGDIATGSGADRLEFLAGTVTGDMSLGAGANSLTVDGGAVVKGALTAQGGTLALTVGSGTLQVNSATPLSLTSLNLGAGSTTILTADPSNNGAATLNVNGAANIASGAKIGVRLASLSAGSQTFTLIHANQLTSGAIDTSLLGQVPFLYDSSLTTNAAAGTVSATLTRKTAASLGLPSTTAAGFEAVLAGANKDSGISSAILAQTNRAGLVSLYNQLLPNHSGSVFDTASATVEAFAKPVDDREDSRGGGFWLQETNIGLFSNGSSDDPGYKAWSFGVVGGYELPATAFGILGVTVGGATNAIYADNVDAASDLHANMMEAGLYWRTSRGGFTANARIAGEYMKVSSDRVISVLGGDGLAVNRTTGADWSAYGVNARAMVAYEMVRGRYYVKPMAIVDYFRLMEDSYTEKGGGAGFDLAVNSRTSSRLTAFAGAAMGAVYGPQRDWGPEVTLGYKGVVSQNLGSTTAKFASGGDFFTLNANDVGGQGGVARLALKGENGSGAFSIEGGAEARDSLTIYDLKLAGHIQF
jgi:hypothetical protein